MKNMVKYIFAGIGLILALSAVFGAAVMLLWNALMPQIFSLPQLNFFQAAGVLILVRILFGGLGEAGQVRAGHRGAKEGGRLFHRNKLREKWMNMSDEERKEFLEKEKDFFKFHRRFSHFNDCFRDGEKTEKNEQAGTKKDNQE
ncbi:MAG: hypothetical protein LBH43_00305 [Treponema sp.]|jgi:hypothetical protein|nr:hypothetical protein [Treponema sp.]